MASTSSTYDSRCNPSLLRTPTSFPGNIPENEIFELLDELVLFQAADKMDDIDSISEQN